METKISMSEFLERLLKARLHLVVTESSFDVDLDAPLSPTFYPSVFSYKKNCNDFYDSETFANLLIKYLFSEKEESNNIFIEISKEISDSILDGRAKWALEMEKINLECSNTTKRTPKVGYVYLVESNNNYKIGKASSYSRIKKYITENPYKINEILFIKVADYTKEENYLLDKYKEKNIRGEWFSLEQAEIESISGYLNSIKID